METKFKMAATTRQMDYLSRKYSVKLYEKMDKEESKFTPKGEEPIYMWKVLLRHPEEMKIPHVTGYSNLLPMLRTAYKKMEKKAKKSIMQEDFEKVLKSLTGGQFVSAPGTFGDWHYSFAFKNDIYLALYSHNKIDPFVRIQDVAGMNEDAIFDLCNWLNENIGCEAEPSSLELSKTYYVGGSSDGKYLYINVD